MRTQPFLVAAAGALLAMTLLIGCQTTPKTQEEKADLEQDAHSALSKMKAADAGLTDAIEKGHGYVIFPTVLPALLTGVALAFARAVGEYGSVVFVAGTRDTTIAPLLIMYQLEDLNFAGAAAIALVLLVASFLINGSINLLSRWSRRHED